MLRPLAAATLLALVGTAAHAPAASPPKLPRGLYKGVVTDPDGDPDSYTAYVRVTARQFKVKRTAARVSYQQPEEAATGEHSLSCRGTLSYRGRSGKGFRFYEVIQGGSKRECLTGGFVTLTPSGKGALRYSWTKKGANRVNPTGALKR